MFVTAPQFQQFLPPGLFGPGEQAWRALSLSTEAPWFLFTFSVRCGSESLVQTMAAAWESTLVDLVQSVMPEDRRAVFCLARHAGSPHGWHMRGVEELWFPSPSEADVTGALLFRFEGEEALSDAHMNFYGPSSGRMLLYGRSSEATRASAG